MIQHAQSNGGRREPPRDRIIREATYQAAVHFHFDTSEEAQKAGLLTVTVMDMAQAELLPPEYTHKFYVMIDQIACFVSRSNTGTYRIEPDAGNFRSEEEIAFREHVLTAALAFWGYPGRYSSKADIIAALLADEEDSHAHPVIQEVFTEEAIEGDPLRAWEVSIGSVFCEVGMFPGEREDEVYFQVLTA